MSIDTAAVSSTMSLTQPSANPSPVRRRATRGTVSEGYGARSPWRTNVRRLFRQRSAITGMIILGIVVFAAIFAPLLAPYPIPTRCSSAPKAMKMCASARIRVSTPWAARRPTAAHHGPGRQCARRLQSHPLRSHASRSSWALWSSSSPCPSARCWAALGGFAGGWVDNVIMRSMDVLLAFPSLLLAIAIAFVLSPGLLNAMLAISIVTIPAYARVVRSTVLSAREMDYVDASRSVGASNTRILEHDRSCPMCSRR